AVLIIILALFAPSSLPHVLKGVFIAGIYVCLAYGAYRLIRFLAGSSRRHPEERRGKNPVMQGYTRAVPPPPPRREVETPMFEVAHTAPVETRKKRNVRLEEAERRANRRRAQRLTPDTPRLISMPHRMTDLTGSMTFAALCTAVIATALALFLPFVSDAGRIALFAGTTLLGSWLVLSVAKLFEGTKTGGAGRRIALLLGGGAVGLAAWFTHDTLLVSFDGPDYNYFKAGLLTSIGSVSLVENGQPTLFGYVLYFAGLFALRRWWWHADTFRKRRFRVSSLLLTALLGCVWSMIVGFPMLWGITWAAAMNVVVQLSAAWVPPQDRPRLMEAQTDAVV
ncbi:MAG: hypothetical protein ACREIV_11350, partial [Planctomycetaceae bacterium]